MLKENIRTEGEEKKEIAVDFALKIPSPPPSRDFSDLLYLIEKQKNCIFPVPSWAIVAASILIIAIGAMGGINLGNTGSENTNPKGIVYYSSQASSNYSGVVNDFSKNQYEE